MQTDINKKNKTNRTNFKYFIMFLILPIVMLLVSGFLNKKNQPALTNNAIPKIEKTLTDGTVVKEFPRELILEKDASVIASQLLVWNSPDKTVNTALVNYLTKTNFGEIFKKYVEYINKNKFYIIKSEATNSQATILAAKNDSSLNIVLMRGEKNTNVGLFLTENKQR